MVYFITNTTRNKKIDKILEANQKPKYEPKADPALRDMQDIYNKMKYSKRYNNG